jgi:hypothetical protein
MIRWLLHRDAVRRWLFRRGYHLLDAQVLDEMLETAERRGFRRGSEDSEALARAYAEVCKVAFGKMADTEGCSMWDFQ